MSHNTKSYRKRIDKKCVESSKKIDVMFNQAIMRQPGSSSVAKQTSTKVVGERPKPHAGGGDSPTPGPSTTQCPAPGAQGGHSSSAIESPESPVESENVSPMELGSEDSSSDEKDADIQVPVPDARIFTSAKYESRYSWLYYNVTKRGYCCKLCELFCPVLLHNNKDNPFVIGIASLGTHPTRKLEGHSASKTHLAAVDKKNVASSSELLRTAKDSKVHSLLLKQKDRTVTCNRQYLSTLIKAIFFVIKKHWALDSVSDVMDHMTEAGHDKVLADYTAMNPRHKYTSSQSVTTLVGLMNEVVEEKILQKLYKAEAYALMADESSDEAHREQFAIIVRFVGEGCEVEEHFLGIINVIRTDAKSLMEAIRTFLAQKGVDITKAVFVGFDGCNVMSGVNKGLQRRFRHLVPHQIYINCRNHKLALCVKHLIKEYPIVDKVDSLLLSIWKLFHYSPRKFATLQEVQGTYNQTKLRMVRASTTRWLSHGMACLRLVERFVQVVDAIDACLEEKYEAEVYGIRQELMDRRTIAGVLILCDVLSPVIRFSNYLQGHVIFSDVMGRCKNLLDELQQLTARFQASLVVPDDSLHLQKLGDIWSEIDERTDLARRLRQPQDLTIQQVIIDIAIPLTYGLINEVTDAFHCTPVLESFQIFNLEATPNDMAEMATYGEATRNW